MRRVLKAVYRLLPWKQQLFTIIRMLWTPPHTVYKHLHFNGEFEVQVRGHRTFRVQHEGNEIENELFWNGLFGGWERQSLRLWVVLCEQAEVILDIGANSGIYALVGKAVQPHATVLAMEPHPRFFAMLEQNRRLNGFDIRAYRAAASDCDGIVNLQDYSGIEQSMRFPAIRLSTLLAQNDIGRVNLIKIDVEGHELQVLDGLGSYLQDGRPTLLIEILSDTMAEAVQQRVEGLGYLYFNINEDSGIRRTNQLEKSDSYNCLLCTTTVAQRLGLLTN